MYRNYIFDLYGTLVDIRTDEQSRGFWRKAVSVFAMGKASFSPGELKRSYRKLVKLAMLKERIMNPSVRHHDIDLVDVFRKLYAMKNIKADDELLLETAKRFRKASIVKLDLYDGVKELLDELRARRKGIYLLTNAQESFTLPELQEVGILRYFDGVLISSQERMCKPEKRFFTKLLTAYELDPRECLMIGNDSAADIQGAKDAGIDGLYIHQEISPPVDDEDAIPAKWKIMDGDVRKIAPLVIQ